MVMAIAMYCRLDGRRENGSASARVAFPIFLVGFVGLRLLNNGVEIPPIMTDGLSQLATGLLLLVVTALGVRPSLREVASIGWRPISLLAGETRLLAAIILWFLLLRSTGLRRATFSENIDLELHHLIAVLVESLIAGSDGAPFFANHAVRFVGDFIGVGHSVAGADGL